MKLHLIIFVLLLNGYLYPARADETAPAVELQSRGKHMALSESALKPLFEQALQLVKTSNFHSDPGDEHHIFTLRGVQSDYRKTVAGKFLVITFTTPQKITTVGGEITVAEIIVGLNRDDCASSLFTIDESGRVIGHAKYSGERCIEILKAIKQLTHDP